jgi:hypothetical protein|tara:strand:- start:1650 stop:1760 length:111 start_codon:yes stop_codon:yes gene_type:complete
MPEEDKKAEEPKPPEPPEEDTDIWDLLYRKHNNDGP